MVSGRAAYRHVVCLSHIVDEQGRKMSKSVGNIINPYEVFDTVGADALRWHFAARVAPDMQKRVSVGIVADVAKGFINTYWNVYAFFVLYARLDEVDLRAPPPDAERPEADRWVISLLEQTVRSCTEALDRYDALGAGAAIEGFIEQLSNWYVRRNRRRFWKAAAGPDKQAAHATLHECLETVNRLMAPFMPFLSESVYQNLVRGERTDAPPSVHMAPWPEHQAGRVDTQLLAEIAVVQRVVALGRAARNDANLKVRQPLARLMVRVPDAAAARAVQRHEAQLIEELNVKQVELLPADASLVSYRIKPNLPVLGKRHGSLLPAIRQALTQLDPADAARAARGENITVEAGGQHLELEPAALLIETAAASGFACAEDGGFLVGLDTALTPALLKEGLARELVRTIQEARKQAGLEVSDRIALDIDGNEAVMAALAEHREYVGNETLTARWERPARGFTSEQHSLGEASWVIRLQRDDSYSA
jgi:isoleucyl-tRNA synthetase